MFREVKFAEKPGVRSFYFCPFVSFRISEFQLGRYRPYEGYIAAGLCLRAPNIFSYLLHRVLRIGFQRQIFTLIARYTSENLSFVGDISYNLPNGRLRRKKVLVSSSTSEISSKISRREEPLGRDSAVEIFESIFDLPQAHTATY